MGKKKSPDLIKKLIAHYKKTINIYDASGVYMDIVKRGCGAGICFCALEKFKMDIYGDIGSIGKYPSSFSTKQINLNRLQKRLDYLIQLNK